MVNKHSFGKPPSIQLCKVITLENFKFIKIETSFHLYNGGSTHKPLITQICKVIVLDNFNSFSIHKITTFKFHHYCQRKHETCDQTLAPIDFNVFKSLIWCYFPKHCASSCVLTLAQCFNQIQHRNPITFLPYKHYHRSCLLHCFF